MSACLQCGKRLVRRARTEYENTNEPLPPSQCTANVDENGKLDYYGKPCRGRKFKRMVENEKENRADWWKCLKCGREMASYSERRRIKSRVFTGGEGYAGRGYFCTLTCGWRFAINQIEEAKQ